MRDNEEKLKEEIFSKIDEIASAAYANAFAENNLKEEEKEIEKLKRRIDFFAALIKHDFCYTDSNNQNFYSRIYPGLAKTIFDRDGLPVELEFDGVELFLNEADFFTRIFIRSLGLAVIYISKDANDRSKVDAASFINLNIILKLIRELKDLTPLLEEIKTGISSNADDYYEITKSKYFNIITYEIDKFIKQLEFFDKTKKII
jgi:hypothetical protein